MPKVAVGEVRWTAEGPVARITMLGKERASFLMSACKTEDEATQRSKLLASLAARFRKAGVIGRPEARTLLETAATCSEALLPGIVTVAGELCGGTLPEVLARVPTFREVRLEWTSGRLHKQFEDHVKLKKDAAQDASRAETLEAIVVTGGVKLGDKPVSKITLDDSEIVMRNLPEGAKRPATRRQYAQVLHRVLGLAVWPCRHMTASPLPKGFMPKAGKPPRFHYLYPAEEQALMQHKATPLAVRVLLGFLAREGCREGEAYAFQVRDFDLEMGTVTLLENKTDDPRSWPLDPAVTRALRAWVKLRGAQPEDFMFVDESGGVFTGDHRMAAVLRASLEAAGVNRRELHFDAKNSRKLRVHDLRGTFVTINLANGKTESWIGDRTGHGTSEMINRYRRASRSAQELGLGVLAPLDEAIPELTNVIETVISTDTMPADSPAIAPESSAPRRIRTYDPRIRSPMLYPAELGVRSGRRVALGRAFVKCAGLKGDLLLGGWLLPAPGEPAAPRKVWLRATSEMLDGPFEGAGAGAQIAAIARERALCGNVERRRRTLGREVVEAWVSRQ